MRSTILLSIILFPHFSSATCLMISDDTHRCRYTTEGDKWCQNNGQGLYSYRDKCLNEHQGYSKPGMRWLQIASRPTAQEAWKIAQQYTHPDLDVRVFLTRNSQYAIVLGQVKLDDRDKVLQKLKDREAIPHDSLYSQGLGYLQDISVGDQPKIVHRSLPKPNARNSVPNLENIIAGDYSGDKEKLYIKTFIYKINYLCGKIPSVSAAAVQMETGVDMLKGMFELAMVLSGKPISEPSETLRLLQDPEGAYQEKSPTVYRASTDAGKVIEQYGCDSVTTTAILERLGSIALR